MKMRARLAPLTVAIAVALACAPARAASVSIGPEGAAVTDILVDPNDPNVVDPKLVAAGTFDGPIMSRYGTSDVWTIEEAWSQIYTEFVSSLGIGSGNAGSLDSDIAYLVTALNRVYRTGAQGYELLPNGWGTGFVFEVVPDPVVPGVVYLAADGEIYRSTNRGDHWLMANSGLTESVSTMAIDTNDTNRLFAGGLFGVHKSTGGDQWSAANSGLAAIHRRNRSPIDGFINPLGWSIDRARRAWYRQVDRPRSHQRRIRPAPQPVERARVNLTRWLQRSLRAPAEQNRELVRISWTITTWFRCRFAIARTTMKRLSRSEGSVGPHGGQSHRLTSRLERRSHGMMPEHYVFHGVDGSSKCSCEGHARQTNDSKNHPTMRGYYS